MLPSKDIRYQHRKQNKTNEQKSIRYYERLISNLKTSVDWKWGDEEPYIIVMEITKVAGVAILITDKLDFKTKGVIRDEDGHYVMIKIIFHDDIYSWPAGLVYYSQINWCDMPR